MTEAPRVMPALLTPFDSDGELEIDSHIHNVGFLTGRGTEGFVLAGSNGEGPYLEKGERQQLLAAAREAAPDAHLMMGIMAETVREGMRQMRETEWADSVLIMTPTTLTRGRPQYVLSYFRYLADASPLPVYLYSVPPNTAYSMEIDLVAELAQHPQVVGMKDSSGDVVRLQAILDATPDDFILYSGASAAVTGAMAVGCHGVITGSGNYAAELVKQTVDSAPDRDSQRRLTALSRQVESHGVPGVKAAAAAYGLRPGFPRLPLKPLGDEARSQIQSALGA
ncbi:MAG TPA: dihydrodipicolinate synthase family protein [Acidimicrobiia bacterium]|nr:dihydrodipicolinate synthase family protein [Acidimicrobiia bacterium]